MIKCGLISELGVQWSNFAQSASGGSDDVTMLHVFVMLIIDIVFYWCWTCYWDAVLPGKYGVGKSFLFPFKNICKVLYLSVYLELNISFVIEMCLTWKAAWPHHSNSKWTVLTPPPKGFSVLLNLTDNVKICTRFHFNFSLYIWSC